MAAFDESRPGLAGFNAFYESRIAPELAALERERRKLLRRILYCAIVVGVFGLPAIGLFFFGIAPLALVPGLIAVAAGLYGAKCYFDIRSGFKSYLVAPICDFFNLDYTAKPSSYPLEWFRELSLLPGYDRSSLEDRIDGDHHEVSLQLVEAKLEKRRTRSTKKGTETTYDTVFRGLLGQFTFPKRFQGRTIVKTDRGTVFNWFQGLATPGERVRLEDPRFEEAFEVHSNDQIEARYLLTPTFMERVLALDRHFGGRATSLAFDAERLWLAVRMRRDLFEGGSIFSKADDPARIQGILEELALVLEIVEILQLQLKTRI